MSSDQQRPPDAAIGPEPELLPPLPDGGLAQVMPDWLRDEPAPAEPADALDPASLVTADDLPDWLRQLGPEPPSAPATNAAAATPQPQATAAVPPPGERPVTLAIPPAPSDEESPPTLTPGTATAGSRPSTPPPATRPVPARVPRPAPHPNPGLTRRKAIVATLGVLLLVLVVVVYVIARGGP